MNIKTKKVLYSSLLALSAFFIGINSISAQTLTGRCMATDGLNMRTGPGTNYSKGTLIPHNATVTILKSNIKTDDNSTGCSTGLWYQVSYSSKTGYVCSRYIEENATSTTSTNVPTNNFSTMTDTQFNAYLNEQGFPESYKTKLLELHKKHPNWVFVGVKSRDNWSTTLKNEKVSGRSLIQTSNQGYLSTADGDYNWYTNKFTVKEGSSWYQANEDTIEYYMDPRNFLNEKNIFMFEDLNYYSKYQTIDAVNKILYTDFYKNLNKYYIDAAVKYNVSPIYLAALSRQEVGLNGGTATKGNEGSTCSGDYNGYYNFYNIGAYTGVCDGLKYAKNKGWNSQSKAIIDGAGWIANGYINKGQNTPYFQKWNTSSNATNKYYYHQYMANISAVVSSSTSTYNSYNTMGILNYPIVFQIPIYSGIPSSCPLPNKGNPNNYLKTLTVNNQSVSKFDGATTSYTMNLLGKQKVTIGATAVASTSTITGTGNFSLEVGTTTKTITVKAANGNTKNYTIKFVVTALDNTPVINDDNNNNSNSSNSDSTGNNTYETAENSVKNAGYKIKSNYMYNITLGSTVDSTINNIKNKNKYANVNIYNSSSKSKTSGSLATGDKVEVASGTSKKTYTVVIYGDITGDGSIDLMDLAKIKKYMLNKTSLTGAYKEAANANRNDTLDMTDLAKLKMYLLKKSNISQS